MYMLYNATVCVAYKPVPAYITTGYFSITLEIIRVYLSITLPFQFPTQRPSYSDVADISS